MATERGDSGAVALRVWLMASPGFACALARLRALRDEPFEARGEAAGRRAGMLPLLCFDGWGADL